VHSDLSRSNIGIRQENGRLKSLVYPSHQSTERSSSKQQIGNRRVAGRSDSDRSVLIGL